MKEIIKQLQFKLSTLIDMCVQSDICVKVDGDCTNDCKKCIQEELEKEWKENGQ